MIEVNGLIVALKGKIVLEDISFKVAAGEKVGIIGPNGAGKTTLLRAILGLAAPLKGTVSVMGHPSRQLQSVRERIGYMPQRHSFERRFPFSASDVIGTGLLSPAALMRHLSRGEKEKISAALSAVNMLALAGAPFQDLSGGEQQRVLLARALVREPALLILDEPNAAFDLPAQHLFFELLEQLRQKRNLTLLLVSHDLLAVAAFADRLLCINRTMHLHGHPKEVLQNPNLGLAYRCEFDYLHKAQMGAD